MTTEFTMTKKLTLKRNLMGIACMLCLAFNAQAASIDLFAAHPSVIVGDQVTLDVGIKGLGELSGPALGDYDVDVHFNNTLLRFDHVVWGDQQKGNQLDLNGIGSLQLLTESTDTLNLFELSFDSVSDLTTQQWGDFRLFSLVFTSLSQGVADFSLSVNALGDAFGHSLAVDSIDKTQVNIVNPTPVSEPSNLLLLIGGFALMGLRKKF